MSAPGDVGRAMLEALDRAGFVVGLRSDLEVSGQRIVDQFVRRYPEHFGDTPGHILRDLATLLDEHLLDARVKKGIPRRHILEDGKRGGTAPRR